MENPTKFSKKLLIYRIYLGRSKQGWTYFILTTNLRRIRKLTQRGQATCSGPHSYPGLERPLKPRRQRSCSQISTTDAWDVCPWCLSVVAWWSPPKFSSALSSAPEDYNPRLVARMKWDIYCFFPPAICRMGARTVCVHTCVSFTCPYS